MARLMRSLIVTAAIASTLVVSSVSAQTKKIPSDADLAAIGHRRIDRSPNLYSGEKEEKLGEYLTLEVQRSSKLLLDSVVIEYINRIASQLSKNSDARFPIRVTIIDSDAIDALSLPGGFQYVNTGLLQQTENEAELAGVLAHGIAHTALRTNTNTATKGELMEPTAIPLMLLGPVGWAGDGVYQRLNIGIPLTYLKYRRDAELDADYFGLQYLSKTGYDAEPYVEFMDRVWPMTLLGKNSVPSLSLYPPLPDRLKAMRKEIAEILPRQPAAKISSVEFETFKERLQALRLAYSGSKDSPAPDKPMLRKK